MDRIFSVPTLISSCFVGFLLGRHEDGQALPRGVAGQHGSRAGRLVRFVGRKQAGNHKLLSVPEVHRRDGRRGGISARHDASPSPRERRPLPRRLVPVRRCRELPLAHPAGLAVSLPDVHRGVRRGGVRHAEVRPRLPHPEGLPLNAASHHDVQGQRLHARRAAPAEGRLREALRGDPDPHQELGAVEHHDVGAAGDGEGGGGFALPRPGHRRRAREPHPGHDGPRRRAVPGGQQVQQVPADGDAPGPGEASPAEQTRAGQQRENRQGRAAAGGGRCQQAVPSAAGPAPTQPDDHLRTDQHHLATHQSVLLAVAGQTLSHRSIARRQGDQGIDLRSAGSRIEFVTFN